MMSESLAFILGGASVYAHSTPVTETIISDTVITKYWGIKVKILKNY